MPTFPCTGLVLAALAIAAPVLDTAYPDGWKYALQQVADTPFELAIPAHGAPLTRSAAGCATA